MTQNRVSFVSELASGFSHWCSEEESPVLCYQCSWSGRYGRPVCARGGEPKVKTSLNVDGSEEAAVLELRRQTRGKREELAQGIE